MAKEIELTPQNIGDELRELRKSKGKTIIQLADSIGVNELTIRRIETNQNSPSFNMLALIAQALGKKVVLK